MSRATPPPRADAAATGLQATVLHHGRRLQLGPAGVRIGRLPDNDVTIPSGAVSRHHAEIRPMQGGFCVVDLGSRNGTQLNGERFRGEARWLANGDTSSIGGEALRFLAGRGDDVRGRRAPRARDDAPHPVRRRRT